MVVIDVYLRVYTLLINSTCELGLDKTWYRPFSFEIRNLLTISKYGVFSDPTFAPNGETNVAPRNVRNKCLLVTIGTTSINHLRNALGVENLGADVNQVNIYRAFWLKRLPDLPPYL